MKPDYEPVEQDLEKGDNIDPANKTGGRRKALVVAGVGIGIIVSALFALFAQGDIFTDTMFNSSDTGAKKQGAGILFVYAPFLPYCPFLGLSAELRLPGNLPDALAILL